MTNPPPLKWQIPTLRARCGRSIPPLENGYFRFLLIESYSERSDVADQIADLPINLENGYFRFLLIESYSERSDVAVQVADLSPSGNDGYFRFLLIESYSERSDVADQVWQIYPPWKMAILDSYL